MLLLKPRGFCAGVVRAIDLSASLLKLSAHLSTCAKKSCTTVLWSTSLPPRAPSLSTASRGSDGERVIYSATAFRPEVRQESKLRELRVIDATCPLVTKVHVEAVKFASEGYSLILIGHRDHDEVIGTLGEAPLVTQVVGCARRGGRRCRSRPGSRGLSHPDYVEPGRDHRHDRGFEEEIFPTLRGRRAGYLLCHGKPADRGERCGGRCDLLLVVGSDNSSNSNRLVEVARNLGTNSHLIDSCIVHQAGVAE